ncbi:MAG: hypothetical protein Kow00124_04500 [Anaerolineae bacterium]
MDKETAGWLANLIQEAAMELEHNPGLTIEVDGEEEKWVQIIPEADDEGHFAGFTLNFPYRGQSGDPLITLTEHVTTPPPGSLTIGWEDGGYARLHIRQDIPLTALAFFINDLLVKLLGAAENPELAIRIEYGF